MPAKINACFTVPTGERNELTEKFTAEKAAGVRHFHATIPGYRETELKSLPALAAELGLASLQVKDESSRFGLNAFKSLGGSYCLARYLADACGVPADEMNFEDLLVRRQDDRFDGLKVVTTTDGNHGRGLAWASRMFGVPCQVYMPKGSAAERLDNIRAQGAEAEILPLQYDDAVRYAHAQADENGWELMQDTAIAGREYIVEWLMQGYMTMADEIRCRWQGEPPTHILLQAGVGSMAGAMAACLWDIYREQAPKIIVVESDRAACLYETAKAADGTLHAVGGDLDTIMAGLACGEVCRTAWNLLQTCACCWLSVSDEVTELAMRRLARPLGDDPVIESGESGAVTTGVVMELMQNPAFALIREQLGLGTDSRVLTLSTEGATDRADYARVLAEN